MSLYTTQHFVESRLLTPPQNICCSISILGWFPGLLINTWFQWGVGPSICCSSTYSNNTNFLHIVICLIQCRIFATVQYTNVSWPLTGKLKRTALFWVIMQQVVVIRNYHYSLHNNTEECSSHLLHSRSLKTCKKIEDKSIKVHEYIKKMTLSKNFLSAWVQ